MACLLLASGLARSGAALPEPEDREIPPDRGGIRLLEKDFRLCVQRLRSPSTPLDRRVEAVGAFALTHDVRAVPALAKIVQRDAREPIALRVAALWALGEIGHPRGSQAKLYEKQYRPLGLAALQYALGKIYFKDKAWRYDEGLTVEVDGQRKRISLEEMIAAQLAKLAEPFVSKYAKMLMEPVLAGTTGQQDDRADKRRTALVTLAAVGDRDGRAVQALCDVLRADDKYYPWDFKVIAAEALSTLVRQRRKLFATLAAKDKLLDGIAAAFIETAVITDVPEVRAIVGSTLREMGWADRAGKQLAIVLESPTLPKAARYRTIEALAHIRSKEAADVLIVQLYDRDPNVRWRAAISLGATGHKNAVTFLAKLTKDENRLVRTKALAALGHLEDPMAIPYLAVAMDDPEWRVRTQAALALGRTGHHAAIATLVGRGLSDPSAKVRAMAIVALGYLKRQEGLKHVATMLTDPKGREKNAGVRLVIVQVLDQFINPGATTALVVALGDEDPRVRAAASKGIKDRLVRKPEHTLPLLAEIVAKGKGRSRGSALGCIADDYRSTKARNRAGRRTLYQRLLGKPTGPLYAALISALTDPHGGTRLVAADFLLDLAWRRKDKGTVARIAALDKDPDAKVRTVARRARNYLANMP